MDYTILKNELKSRESEFKDLSDDKVAEILNSKDFKLIKSRFINERTILAEIGGQVGATILDKLDAISPYQSAVRRMLKFLAMDSGVDIGHQGTLSQITSIVSAGGLTQVEGELLKGLALLPASRCEVLGIPSVTYNDINVVRSQIAEETMI